MALRKKTDKKVTGISAFVTIAFYVIIAAIFWNVGGGEIIKEFVITAAAGRRPPPPPPPKRTPPKIKLKQPPKIRPKFKVASPKFHGAGVRPDFGKAIIPVMDNESDLSNISRMAKMYEIAAVSQSVSQMKSAALDIGSKLGFGLGDIAGGRRTVVVGSKRRMRAKITLARIGHGHWLRLEGTIPAMLAFLNEETSIKPSTEVKKFDHEETFIIWYKKHKERISGGSAGTEIDPESGTLKELGQEVSNLHGNVFAYRANFVRELNRIWLKYLKTRYPLAAESFQGKEPSFKDLYAKIRETYRLSAFEIRGLKQSSSTVSGYTEQDANETTNRKRLQVVYDYLRKAEWLHYPFTFSLEFWPKNPVGEIISHMANYCRCGGFLYLDDLTVGNNRHLRRRRLIGNIMNESTDPEEKVVLARTFKKLSKGDRSVSGYELGRCTPDPFYGNTFTAIPYSLPRTSNVTLKVYNRVASLVRMIEQKNVLPGRYGGRGTGGNEAPIWDCRDDAGQPVESGAYFVQMQTGLFQQTRRAEMSDLRKLDPKTHPIFTSYFTFTGTPTCKIAPENIERKEDEREYGTTTFGWAIGERTCLVYTEWAGILQAVGSKNVSSAIANFQSGSADRFKPARQFFTNILVFGLSQPGGLAQRI